METKDESISKAYVAVACEIATVVGEFLMQQAGKARFREKSPGDLVTEADEEAQRQIFASLNRHFPNHSFLGEEDAPNSQWNRGFCWIVDPIDGTRNFIYQLPSFSISMALFFDGKPIVGVVHDPLLKETFTAIRNQGAWKNDEPIKPTATVSLAASLLVCSFPAIVTSDCPELVRFNRVVQRATLRRLGSAALNLCYVASGRLDGYWASNLKLWDIAAGVLIAREAGAHIIGLDGKEFDFANAEFCVCSTKKLATDLLPLLQL